VVAALKFIPEFSQQRTHSMCYFDIDNKEHDDETESFDNAFSENLEINFEIPLVKRLYKVLKENSFGAGLEKTYLSLNDGVAMIFSPFVAIPKTYESIILCGDEDDLRVFRDGETCVGRFRRYRKSFIRSNENQLAFIAVCKLCKKSYLYNWSDVTFKHKC
jgi:hypothetical protein